MQNEHTPPTPNPQVPPFQPATPVQPAPTQSLKLPIILMTWPLASIVIAIIGYAILNFALSAIGGGLPDALRAVTNAILFLVGALGLAAGPISFIAGLVLLIVRLSRKGASV